MRQRAIEAERVSPERLAQFDANTCSTAFGNSNGARPMPGRYTSELRVGIRPIYIARLRRRHVYLRVRRDTPRLVAIPASSHSSAARRTRRPERTLVFGIFLAEKLVRKIPDAMRRNLDPNHFSTLDQRLCRAANMLRRISCQFACREAGRIFRQVDQFIM